MTSLGALQTGLCLRDAYHDALARGPLPLTTHADDFAGCIDYCWVSCGPPNVEEVEGGSGHRTPLEAGAVDCSVAPRVEVLEVLDMPYDVAHPELFGRIPSADWPSDHLALGVLLGIPLPSSRRSILEQRARDT